MSVEGASPPGNGLEGDIRSDRWETLRGDAVTLLTDLVAIDSQNPGLVPGGAGERAIADHVEAWAQANGLRTRRLKDTPGRPSVVVTATGAGGGRRLMLCGHLDTVGVDEVGLDFRIDGDRMYGRGTYDMKAGLAAALISTASVPGPDSPATSSWLPLRTRTNPVSVRSRC